MNFHFLRWLFVIFVVAGCARPEDPKLTYDPGEVIATINEKPIHAELFEETYINFLSRTGFTDSELQRYFHLNTMIDMYLLSDEAESRGMNDELFEDYLHKTRLRSLRNLFVKNEFLLDLEMPDDANTRLAFYRTKQKPYVRQLFFLNKSDADLYYNRLESGEDFVDLANELYVTAQYDSLAGFLGEITYFGVDDVFAETAYTLEAGEYSEPVRTRQGYVIIRVDNWNFNPIVTETEYANRKEKIQYFLHQRDFQMGADVFIRNYMESLNPQLDRENLQRVFIHMRQRLPRAETLDFTNMPAIRGDQIFGNGELDPLMPLVTFEIEGEVRAFRLQDYMLWMESLPLQEMITRFDASVGRALMWDTFAKESIRKGYDANPFVEFNATSAGRFYQAARLQDSLKSMPTKPFDESDLIEAFDRFGMATLKSTKMTFWVAKAGGFNEAKEIRDSVLADEEAINSIPQSELHKDVDPAELYPDLNSHLLVAPFDEPYITGTQQGWYVIKVFDREMEYHRFESRKSDVENLLSPIYNEFTLLRTLRENSSIEVDTTAFRKLMSYYPN
jgi:hypothetical protein